MASQARDLRGHGAAAPDLSRVWLPGTEIQNRSDTILSGTGQKNMRGIIFRPCVLSVPSPLQRFCARMILPQLLVVLVGNAALAQDWVVTSAPTRKWKGVACSADGAKVVAVCGTDYDRANSGEIFLSSDFGLTWSKTNAPPTNWSCVTASADGTRLAAGVWGAPIHTSKDAGQTWDENDVLWFRWYSIASSADGFRMAAAPQGSGISAPLYTLDLRNTTP